MTTSVSIQHGRLKSNLEDFAKQVGLQYVFSKKRAFGTKLNGKVCVDTLWDFTHEIGHYLICPAKRKHLPFYGLGDPESFNGVGSVVSDKAAWKEEEEASLLGWIIYENCGAGLKDLEAGLEFHAWGRRDKHMVFKWDDLEKRKMLRLGKKLIKKKLINRKKNTYLGYSI